MMGLTWTDEQIRILLSLSDGLELDLRATTPEVRANVEFMCKCNLVEYAKRKDDRTDEMSILVKISELGKMQLGKFHLDKREKIKHLIEYIITTLIAVSALILAVISILMQNF